MPDDLNDDELEQRLRSSLRDPVPDEVLRASEGLFTWRTIDAELAALERVDAEQVGVRGATSTLLTFVVDDQLIEVDVADDDGTVVVDLGGRWAAGIQLVTPDGTVLSAPIDEAGICRFEGAPRGPIQLVVTRIDGTSVKTRWATS